MSARIKGTGLMLKLGSPAVDHYADCTSVVLDNEEADSDVITFEDAAVPGGARKYFFDISAIQSTDATSLWSIIWADTGLEKAFTFAPHGNAVPSATKPHFTGTVRIGPRPAIGGEAGQDKTHTFETRWEVLGTPDKITSAP